MRPILFIISVITILSVLSCPAAAEQTRTKKVIDEALGSYDNAADRTLPETAQRALNSGIPPEEIAALITAAAQAGRPSEEASSFLIRLIGVQKKGMPTEIITDSIIEGIARNISKDAILSAVNSQEERLSFCRDTAMLFQTRGKAGKRRNKLLVKTLFNSMNTGFTEKQLDTIGSAVMNDNRNTLYFINVLKIMMELRYYGVESRHIVNLMQRSIQRGFSISDMQSYPKIVSRDFQKGVSEEDSIAGMMKDVESGIAPFERLNDHREGSGGRSDTSSGGTGSSSGGSGGGGAKGSSSGGGGKSGPSN